MQTELIEIKGEADFPRLAAAGRLLREGRLVAFPTETVYGLGGNALDAAASEKIYRAKGRPSDNPLIVHIADPRDAGRYCVTCPLYETLAARFMPGPLTVILPKRYEHGVPVIPDATSGGLDSAALRCPVNPIAHALILAAGVPIAAPSANTSGRPSPTTAQHVLHDLGGKIDAVIDGGAAAVGLESTVVQVADGVITLLRPGAVTAEDLRTVTDRVVIAPDSAAPDEHPLSPGMKYKHYSPNKPLTLLAGEREAVLRFMAEKQAEEHCALICYAEDVPHLADRDLLILGPRDNPAEQAHRLFDCLRQADVTGADTIYAHLPDKAGIGLALYNRLIRAAAHRVLQVK